MSKGKPLIGTVKLPYQHVEKLQEAAAARSRINREDRTSNIER